MSRTTNRLLMGLLLTVGLVGVGWDARASLQPTTNSAQPGTSKIRFVPRVYRAASKRLRYTAKARYPQATRVSDPRLATMNRLIRDTILKEANEFKSFFKTPEPRFGPMGSYFEADYVITYSTNDVVSVYFNIDTYGEGAAHPNHNSLTVNYDLKTGKQLQMADVFEEDSYWLNAVSSISVKDLTKQLGSDSDEDWIKSGAGLKAENFKNWNITTKGLQITFDPYQVASYAAGPHEVVIPYASLKNEIDANGPLGRVTNIRR